MEPSLRHDRGVHYERSRGSNKRNAPHSIDARMARLAARQHGLVTAAQLKAFGLGRAAVANRVADGRLHAKHRGVYAVGHARLSQRGLWMAAVLAAGEGAVLSHLAAAKLWEVWRRRVPAAIDVTTPRQRRQRTGIRVHFARHLDPRDVTVHDGIPVTTVARMLVDLSSVQTAPQLANVIHEAAFRNRFDLKATRQAMTRAAGRHELDVLTAALDAHLSGSAGTKSALEDQFLAEIQAQGRPEPLVNTKLEGIEVDFHWPDQNVCIEIDGPGHERPRTRNEDRARDATLQAAGHEVIRLAR
jgi:predicted transcriptional regulator of viral defense system